MQVLMGWVQSTPCFMKSGVQAAGLTAEVADPEAALTVLAPADSAFSVIPADDLAGLLANTDALSQVRTRPPTCVCTCGRSLGSGCLGFQLTDRWDVHHNLSTQS